MPRQVFIDCAQLLLQVLAPVVPPRPLQVDLLHRRPVRDQSLHPLGGGRGDVRRLFCGAFEVGQLGGIDSLRLARGFEQAPRFVEARGSRSAPPKVVERGFGGPDPTRRGLCLCSGRRELIDFLVQTGPAGIDL